MKHFLITTLAAFVGFSASSSAQVRLNGQLSNLGNSTVIIQYFEGNTAKTANLKVTEGKFTWTAPVTEAQKITMIFPGRATWIFVDPGTVTVKGNRDSVENLTVTGSKTNDEAVVYARLIKPLEEEEKPLLLEYSKLNDDTRWAWEEKHADIIKRKNAIANTYISAHRESAFSLNLITEFSRLGNYEDISRMYNMLGGKIKSSSEAKRLAERLAILKRSAVGEKMMAFTKNDDKGNLVSLSGYEGKYLYIDFWASWCAPCRREIPNLIKTYNHYKTHDFAVLSISLDDPGDKSRWLAAVDVFKMPWAQVCDLKGWSDDLAVFYGLKAVPSTFLIDPKGNIIARDLRGVALDKKLKELFM